MQNYQGLSLIYSRNADKVYSATSRQDKQKYILKWIKQAQVDSNKLAKEIQVHQQLRNQNIVYLKNHFNHLEGANKYLVLVLEYCSGGSLDQSIPNNQLDLVDRMSWLLDAAYGINYLHQNKIIHRDIKPQNILLSRGKAKVGDLGISRYLNEQSSEDMKKLGTSWYNSPEIYQGQEHGFQTDIWSFGIVCLEVISNQRINQLVQGQAPPAQRKDFPNRSLTQNISLSTLRKLVKGMLSKKKQKRPTIDLVIQKLQKSLKKLVKSCKFQQINLQLPLQSSKFDVSEAKTEWINRIDPSKQSQKAKLYTIKTKLGKQVKGRFDDYKQTLKIKYQQMEVIYQYKNLPLQLKKYFKNLGELNNLLKQRNNKIEFGTNGNLIFSYKKRQQYDPQSLVQSMNRSSLSSALTSKQQEEEPIEEQVIIIKSKYVQHQPIPQVQEEHSSQRSYQFGEKLSSQAKSKGKTEKKADKFIQQKADNSIRQEPEQQKQQQPVKQSPQPINNPQPKIQQKQPQQPKQSQNPQAQKPSLPQKRNLLGFMLKKTQVKPKQEMQEQIVEPSEIQARPLIDHQQSQPPLRPQPRQQQRRPNQHHQAQSSQSIQQRILDLQKEIEVLELVDGPQRVVLPDNYVLLAREYLKIKNLKRSQQIFRLAIEKYTDQHLRYSDKCAHVFYQLGKIYLKYDQLEDQPQIQQNELILEYVEKPLSPLKKKALQEFETAVNTLYYLKSNDYKTFSKVNNKIGKLYLQSNQLLFAEGFFSNALNQIKDFSGEEKKLAFDPTLNLGKLYNRMGSYHQALPYLMQCMEIINKFENLKLDIFFVLDQLTQTYIGLKDFSRALQNLQKLGVFWVQLPQSKFKNVIFNRFQKHAEKLMLVLVQKPDPSIKPHLIKLLNLFQNYMPKNDQKIMLLKSVLEKI